MENKQSYTDIKTYSFPEQNAIHAIGFECTPTN